MALPNFRYKAVHEGIMENEICPVLIGFCSPDLTITPNYEEVESIEWVSRDAFSRPVKIHVTVNSNGVHPGP